jgi:hypothetical protein
VLLYPFEESDGWKKIKKDSYEGNKELVANP